MVEQGAIDDLQQLFMVTESELDSFVADPMSMRDTILERDKDFSYLHAGWSRLTSLTGKSVYLQFLNGRREGQNLVQLKRAKFFKVVEGRQVWQLVQQE